MRGEDSTGIIRADKDGKINTRKSLLASPEFIRSTASDIMMDEGKFKDKKPVLLMGHTRAATKGAVSLKNAHPFSFDKVVGMHNGTIHKQFKHRSEYETDSEALYKNINDYGLKPALEEANAWDTAYALQFVNKEDKTLNFVKNSKRPLWFTYLYNRTTLIWASEKKMLEFVLQHKNMHNNEGLKDSKEKFFTLEVNHLMTLGLGKSLATLDFQKLGIEEKKTYTTTTTTYHYGKDGATQTSQTTGKSPYTNGTWLKTDTGYQWVERRGPAQEIKKPTTTTTGTSSKEKLSTDTASGTTHSTSSTGQSNGKSGKDEYGYSNHKDHASMDQLRQLSWLQPIELRERPAEDPQDKSQDTFAVTATLFEKYVRDKKGKDRQDCPVPNPSDSSYTIKGYKGQAITESEFRYRLSCGCFSCGQVYSLSNPHDFEGINNIHWWDREYWACDECYKSPDGNHWVRRCIEDDWSDWDEESPAARAVRATK